MFQIQANKYIQYAGEKNNTEVLICKQIMENLAYGERIVKAGLSDIGNIREIIDHMLWGEFVFKHTVGTEKWHKIQNFIRSSQSDKVESSLKVS